jgi:hypothetical protein
MGPHFFVSHSALQMETELHAGKLQQLQFMTQLNSKHQSYTSTNSYVELKE